MNAAFGAARRPLVVGLALLSSACAVDRNTGAQSIAGMKVSDDPCAKTATAVGAIIGAITGAVVANQINHRGDTKIIGITAGAGVGALIGREVDRRRCELFKIAQKHNATLSVAPIVLPEGPLAPPGAKPETTERRDTPGSGTAAAPANGRETTAGLTVTLRDSGRQFEIGSDQLTPQGRAFFVDVAEQYSYARQLARLAPNATQDERDSVDTLRNKRILLVGHTDDTGSSRGNADLSERRAMAVARVFRSQGIPDAQLYYQGAGETLPIADNRTEEGRAQNRRVEIVDVTDDSAFQKYLASRKQRVEFYRAAATAPAAIAATSTPDRAKTSASSGFDDTLVLEGGAKPKPGEATSAEKSPSATVPSKPTTPARGRAPGAPAATAPASAVVSASNASAASGALDFGGVLASTVVAAADFGNEIAPRPGFSLISTAYASGGPVVPNCSSDRPRVTNGVKSLRDQRDISITEYMPGLYNTSWMDTVNGNLVGLSNVAVLRDGGSPANRPNLFVYRAYKPGSGAKPDLSAQPDVNAYRGDKAILYRVFVDGPLKCMDVVFPYDNSGQAKNSNLFYQKEDGLYVAAFKPRLAR